MEGFKEYFPPENVRGLRKSQRHASQATDKKRAVWPNVEEAYERGVLEPLRQIFKVEVPLIKENRETRQYFDRREFLSKKVAEITFQREG